MVATGTVSSPYLVLKIRRDHIIEDALSELSRYPHDDLQSELKVQFVGEEGIDQGGVQKEFFQLVVREIFDAKFGMFVHDEKTRSYWFNSASLDTRLEYELIGTILGLAIYNAVILDVHFPQVVYKKLMGYQKPTLKDLEDTNPELASGLKKLLAFDGDVESMFAVNFQISYQTPFGETITHSLKEDGANIPLTNPNREEYVKLYVEYLLEESVRTQFDAFFKGFKLVCDGPAWELFRWEELELLVCGSQILDFEALQNVTIYDNGYHDTHPVIQNFWEVVHSLTEDEKKQLLFFSTGSDRSPIGGLSKLHFIITRHGPDSDRLPSAHTCFNHLLLPEYQTKEKLRDRLLAAIHNAEGFGLM